MKILFKNKYCKLNEDYDLDKILYLLIDRPFCITKYSLIWRKNKEQLHREYDLPAYIGFKGYVEWYKNHKFHRENNKPARIFYNGYYCYKEYFINGIFIKEEK